MTFIGRYRNEAFSIIGRNNWNAEIFTNASVFNQKLADLMARGLVKIHVSMDAGTPETFTAVKGVDCYDKVVSNLRQYSDSEKYSSQIELKYIVLPELNDNNTDVDGFVELAHTLNATVYISSDMRYLTTELPKQSFDSILHMVKELTITKVKFSFVKEFFNPITLKKINAELIL